VLFLIPAWCVFRGSPTNDAPVAVAVGEPQPSNVELVRRAIIQLRPGMSSADVTAAIDASKLCRSGTLLLGGVSIEDYQLIGSEHRKIENYKVIFCWDSGGPMRFLRSAEMLNGTAPVASIGVGAEREFGPYPVRPAAIFRTSNPT